VNKKTNISISVTPELKDRLRKIQNYSLVVQAAVETYLNICPTCHQLTRDLDQNEHNQKRQQAEKKTTNEPDGDS
jgi:hypothetical protein